MDDGVNSHTFDGLLWVLSNVSKIWHHCLRMQHVDIMPQMGIFAIIDSQGIYIYPRYSELPHIFSNGISDMRVSRNRDTPIAGWLISGKIPI